MLALRAPEGSGAGGGGGDQLTAKPPKGSKAIMRRSNAGTLGVATLQYQELRVPAGG